MSKRLRKPPANRYPGEVESDDEPQPKKPAANNSAAKEATEVIFSAAVSR